MSAIPMRGSSRDNGKERASMRESLSIYKRIFKDMKGSRLGFILIFACLAIAAICNILSPFLLSNILNQISQDMLALQEGRLTDVVYFSVEVVSGVPNLSIIWNQLVLNFSIILGLYVLSAASTWFAEWTVIKINAKYTFSLRKRLKEKLDVMPLNYFDTNSTGQLLSRCTNDVDNISANINQIINQLISGAFVIVSVLVAMFIIDWTLALVAIATLPLSLIAVVIIGKRSQKQFKSYREELGELSGVAEEVYGGLNVIKLYRKEEHYEQIFTAINERMAKYDAKSQWVSGFIFPTMRFISNLGYVGISVIGGLVSNVGGIVMFLMYLQIFQQPFLNIGSIIGTIQSVASGAVRIYELLDADPQIEDKPDAINTEDNIVGDIVFNDVSFSYTPEKPLIEHMNLNAPRGNTIAIVGPTGAGKTTLVNLIMRFYEINDGSITLDGHDLRDYTRGTIRGSVGMVLQDAWLFNGTIRDNLKYGNLDATEEEILSAIKAARADHFVETLPGGLDFMLNEDATNISQGQKQLLTIARAIVSKPKIMILDEATSSVDTRTEKAIQDAMNDMMKGRTSFVIAHRLSTIKNAQTILVMKNGNIIEIGNHEELLEKNGFYAELYNSQFLGNNPLAPNEEQHKEDQHNT